MRSYHTAKDNLILLVVKLHLIDVAPVYGISSPSRGGEHARKEALNFGRVR